MRLRRLGNPFVRALLRSPLHRLLSASLVLVTYTGRRSGRTFTIPVMYAEEDGSLLVYVGRSDKKVWWRNLSGGTPVRVRVRGQQRSGTGTALSGDGELRARYLARFPRAAASLEADPAPIFVRITGVTPAGS